MGDAAAVTELAGGTVVVAGAGAGFDTDPVGTNRAVDPALPVAVLEVVLGGEAVGFEVVGVEVVGVVAGWIGAVPVEPGFSTVEPSAGR